MALTEQTIPIGVYDVTCDKTWCTARYQGGHDLNEESTRQVAAVEGWTCDVSGDWCPEHAPAEVDGTHALIARGVAKGLRPPLMGRRFSVEDIPLPQLGDMDKIPLLERGYSRPIDEDQQTTMNALASVVGALTSAMADAHAGIDARLNQRHGYIEEMAAAYLTHTMIAPEDAVLFEQRDGLTTRWWFEVKEER